MCSGHCKKVPQLKNINKDISQQNASQTFLFQLKCGLTFFYVKVVEECITFPSVFECCRIHVPRYFCSLSPFCSPTEDHSYCSVLDTGDKGSISGYQKRKLFSLAPDSNQLQPCSVIEFQARFHVTTSQCCGCHGFPRKYWANLFPSKLTRFPTHCNAFLSASGTPRCRQPPCMMLRMNESVRLLHCLKLLLHELQYARVS